MVDFAFLCAFAPLRLTNLVFVLDFIRVDFLGGLGG